MNRSAATLAVAGARVRLAWPIALLAFAVALATAFVHVERSAALFLAIATVLAMAATVAREPRRVWSRLRLLEQSAPLYGREWARALVIVPSAIVFIATLLFWAAHARGNLMELALEASVALALSSTACSARLRSGAAERTLYVLLLAALGSAAIECERFGGFGALAAIALSVIVGYFALRAYGETLARYDPLP